ncbi:hypothetical protein PR048_020523 [Dryococelus australis]|uniref:Uncharacterized protein n=1 Tax=Dryococelus australis TaxID=614101 RepID=A0ABQ9H6H7_9NEOP|nr:hypothetical protein PR048_020523 [Dryococelus australis]
MRLMEQEILLQDRPHVLRAKHYFVIVAILLSSAPSKIADQIDRAGKVSPFLSVFCAKNGNSKMAAVCPQTPAPAPEKTFSNYLHEVEKYPEVGYYFSRTSEMLERRYGVAVSFMWAYSFFNWPSLIGCCVQVKDYVLAELPVGWLESTVLCTNADINCTLVVCCHSGRRRLGQRLPGGVKHRVDQLLNSLLISVRRYEVLLASDAILVACAVGVRGISSYFTSVFVRILCADEQNLHGRAIFIRLVFSTTSQEHDSAVTKTLLAIELLFLYLNITPHLGNIADGGAIGAGAAPPECTRPVRLYCRIGRPPDILVHWVGLSPVCVIDRGPANFALLFYSGLDFTVLYVKEPASFLHWLLHRCEVTPFLTELLVIGAHNCEVFMCLPSLCSLRYELQTRKSCAVILCLHVSAHLSKSGHERCPSSNIASTTGGRPPQARTCLPKCDYVNYLGHTPSLHYVVTENTKHETSTKNELRVAVVKIYEENCSERSAGLSGSSAIPSKVNVYFGGGSVTECYAKLDSRTVKFRMLSSHPRYRIDCKTTYVIYCECELTQDVVIFMATTPYLSIFGSLHQHHHGDPGSIPGGFTPGFSPVRIVLDDAACLRIFSGRSRSPRPCIPAPLHPRVSFHVVSGDDGHLRAPAGKPVSRTVWPRPGLTPHSSNSAPITEHIAIVCPVLARFSQKRSDFTSMQQPVEKRRRLLYIHVTTETPHSKRVGAMCRHECFSRKDYWSRAILQYPIVRDHDFLWSLAECLRGKTCSYLTGPIVIKYSDTERPRFADIHLRHWSLNTSMLRGVCTCALKVKKRGSNTGDTNTHA